MRAHAEAQAQARDEADGDPPDDLEDEELEDEVDPQDLDDLNLPMEVAGAGGDEAGVESMGPRAHDPVPQ